MLSWPCKWQRICQPKVEQLFSGWGLNGCSVNATLGHIVCYAVCRVVSHHVPNMMDTDFLPPLEFPARQFPEAVGPGREAPVRGNGTEACRRGSAV